MKKILSISLFSAAIFTMVTSCEKEAEKIADFTMTPSSQALVKINYASPYSKNPAVQLKLNGTRVSNNFTYAYPFPGGGLNTGGGSDPLYFPVNAGATTVSLSIPKAGSNIDSLPVYSSSLTAEAGKYYTFHIADTAASTQSFLLEENVAFPDTGSSRFRFVNLIPNLAALDLYYGSTLVAGNVAYKGASPYFTLSRFSVPSTFNIRPAGAAPTTTAISSYPVPASPQTFYTIPNARAITVFARGYNGITAAADVRRPLVSLYFVK